MYSMFMYVLLIYFIRTYQCCLQFKPKMITLAVSKAVENCCELLPTVEVAYSCTDEYVLRQLPLTLSCGTADILANGEDKPLCLLILLFYFTTASNGEVEEPHQLIWE